MYTSRAEPFFRGLQYNRSIKEVYFDGFTLSYGHFFDMIGMFFKNNDSLLKIQVDDCQFRDKGAISQFSSALGECNKSLKAFGMGMNRLEGAAPLSIDNCRLVSDVITSLREHHPQLEKLNLSYSYVGMDVCFPLLFLLSRTTNLQSLDLSGNSLSDQFLDTLEQSIGSCKHLTKLRLTNNGPITVRGWTTLATILELPDCNIKILDVSNIGIDNDGMLVFAKSLATNTNLRNLCLDNNLIDDTIVEILVQTLSNSNRLQNLDISNNSLITGRGWKAVATLLEIPSSLVEELMIHSNSIGDEEARVFANALANNSTLKRLDLDYCGITPEGWKHFKKLICDTSSVNNTYLSNHTLQYLGDEHDLDSEDEHYEDQELDVNITDTLYYLEHNENENKYLVAMSKILKNHSHFNMEFFFEWEFKVLPIMIGWFTKAATCKIGFEEKINKMKLSVIYDFIRELPMLYIEPVTRKKISEYTAKEEVLLQGGQVVENLLKAIQESKARAMRRLGMK